MLLKSVNEAGGGFHFFVNGRFEMAAWLENPMHCIAPYEILWPYLAYALHVGMYGSS